MGFSDTCHVMGRTSTPPCTTSSAYSRPCDDKATGGTLLQHTPPWREHGISSVRLCESGVRPSCLRRRPESEQSANPKSGLCYHHSRFVCTPRSPPGNGGVCAVAKRSRCNGLDLARKCHVCEGSISQPDLAISLLRRSLPAVLALGSATLCPSAAQTPTTFAVAMCISAADSDAWARPGAYLIASFAIANTQDSACYLVIDIAELRPPDMPGGFVLAFALRISMMPRIAD
jgi:hypothetical protein